MHYKKAPRSDDAIPFLRNFRRAVLAVKVRSARAFRATLTAAGPLCTTSPLGRNGTGGNGVEHGTLTWGKDPR
jgi:hypothetical protein